MHHKMKKDVMTAAANEASKSGVTIEYIERGDGKHPKLKVMRLGILLQTIPISCTPKDNHNCIEDVVYQIRRAARRQTTLATVGKSA